MVRKVAVIMGSDSDWPVVKGACAQLKALDIPFEAHILSAHRTPAEAAAQAGYQDYSTFSRAYKKQFGHGPSADTKGKQQDLQITTQEF